MMDFFLFYKINCILKFEQYLYRMAKVLKIFQLFNNRKNNYQKKKINFKIIHHLLSLKLAFISIFKFFKCAYDVI